MPYLGTFGVEFAKNIAMAYLNQQPRICLTAKFREKTKMCKLGNKNVFPKTAVIFQSSTLEFEKLLNNMTKN